MSVHPQTWIGAEPPNKGAIYAAFLIIPLKRVLELHLSVSSADRVPRSEGTAHGYNTSHGPRMQALFP